jgi:DNA modification methylase
MIADTGVRVGEAPAAISEFERPRAVFCTQHQGVLFGGADLVFTDPPYNVDYESYTEDRLTIQDLVWG